VKRLRSFTKGNDALEHEAADRLEELDRALDTAKAHIADLEQENKRLREEAEAILALKDKPERENNPNP
jgi:prefoldin subunit 5